MKHKTDYPLMDGVKNEIGASIVKGVLFLIGVLIFGSGSLWAWNSNESVPEPEKKQVVNTAFKPKDKDTDIGFKIVKPLFRSKRFKEVTEFEPGDYRLYTGEHDRKFRIRFSVSKGGMLGIGSTKYNFVASGSLTGSYNKESFRLMIQKAEESFDDAIISELKILFSNSMSIPDIKGPVAESGIDSQVFQDTINSNIFSLNDSIGILDSPIVIESLDKATKAEMETMGFDNITEVYTVHVSGIVSDVKDVTFSFLAAVVTIVILGFLFLSHQL